MPALVSAPAFPDVAAAIADLAARVRFVLVEPSHPGNVGAAARAIRAMGFGELVLVRPRFPGVAAHPDAVAFASGADDVLAASREVASLADAIGDATLAVASSAGAREFGPAPSTPAQAAARALGELDAHASHRVAFVFGCERTGLSIEDVLACHALACIPTDPEFRSLNLAQAVQVLAWELRRAMLGRVDGRPRAAVPGDAAAEAATPGAPTPASRRARRALAPGRHASAAEIEALFDHLERSLVEIRFLDPAHPKKLMPRLRRLFSRTRLEIEEVDILRGICTQMTAGRGR